MKQNTSLYVEGDAHPGLDGETHSRTQKRQLQSLEADNQSYKGLVRILRTVNLLEACALLQRIRAGEEVQSLLSAAQEGGLLLQLVQTERSDRRPSTPKARARCHFHSEGDPTGGVLRSSVARTVSSVLGESADQQ